VSEEGTHTGNDNHAAVFVQEECTQWSTQCQSVQPQDVDDTTNQGMAADSKPLQQIVNTLVSLLWHKLKKLLKIEPN